MYAPSKYGQWSDSGKDSWNGDNDWQQPGGWCSPKPVCPPEESDRNGEWQAAPKSAVDPNFGWSTCDPDDFGDGNQAWSWPNGNGCSCNFDHNPHGQWGGFGPHGTWQYAFGHLAPGKWGLSWKCGDLAPWQQGTTWLPGHDLADTYDLLWSLSDEDIASVGNLLSSFLPGGLGNWPGLAQAGPWQGDDKSLILHQLLSYGKSPQRFDPSDHWWKPGTDYDGCGCYKPDPCVEPAELGFKVFRYNPQFGVLLDLNDGIGDLGPGNGDPSHRYPWAQEEHGRTLYVGVLNGNPNPQHFLPAILNHFSPDYPFAPTLHTTGPEIWRWNNVQVASVTDGQDGDPAAVIDSQDGGYWAKVLAPEDLDDLLDGQVGIRELFSYEGYLYATTANNRAPYLLQGSQEPAAMIRSKSGDPGTWEEVPRGPGTDDDPFDDPTNSAIHTIAEIRGTLVIGTEKATSLLNPDAGPPEIWLFDGLNWGQVVGDIEGWAVSEIVAFREPGLSEFLQEGGSEAFRVTFDTPFAGNYDPEGYNLYTVKSIIDEDNPDNDKLQAPAGTASSPSSAPLPFQLEDVTPTHVKYIGQGPNLPANGIPDYIVGEPDVDGLYDADDFGDVSPFDDHGIVTMFQYNPDPKNDEAGYLYIGTVDPEDGATLMRSADPDDPTSWELITADGFFSEFGGDAVNTPESGPVPWLNGNFQIWSAAVTGGNTIAELEENPGNGEDDDGFVGNTIYIGTFNGLGGTGQVLKSTDGINFEFVTQNAFGNEDIYGFRSIETVGNEVFFGGASPIDTQDPFSYPYGEDPYAFDIA